MWGLQRTRLICLEGIVLGGQGGALLHWFEIPAGVFTGRTWKGLITKENLTCALKGRP